MLVASAAVFSVTFIVSANAKPVSEKLLIPVDEL